MDNYTLPSNPGTYSYALICYGCHQPMALVLKEGKRLWCCYSLIRKKRPDLSPFAKAPTDCACPEVVDERDVDEFIITTLPIAYMMSEANKVLAQNPQPDIVSWPNYEDEAVDMPQESLDEYLERMEDEEHEGDAPLREFSDYLRENWWRGPLEIRQLIDVLIPKWTVIIFDGQPAMFSTLEGFDQKFTYKSRHCRKE